MESRSVTEWPLYEQDAEEDGLDVAKSAVSKGGMNDMDKSADGKDRQDVAKHLDTEDSRHDVMKSGDTGEDRRDVTKLTDKDVHDVPKSADTEGDTHDVAKLACKEDNQDVAKSAGNVDEHDVAKSADTKDDMAKSADISEELDSLAFRYLDIIQSIICEQDCLLEALSDGFVNMAKARYIMGNKSVSMLQINEGEMKADCLVRAERDLYGGVEYTNFKISEECIRDEEKKDQELRQRKVKNQSKAFNEVDDSVISEENLENIKQKNEIHPPGSNNPLHWFGVLVPKSLRTCQSQFRESLVVAAKVASLKSELCSVYARYRELLAKEKEIQNNS